jgi:hypothetical protein
MEPYDQNIVTFDAMFAGYAQAFARFRVQQSVETRLLRSSHSSRHSTGPLPLIGASALTGHPTGASRPFAADGPHA